MAWPNGPSPARLLREPLVDVGELDLGIDLAGDRDRPEPFASLGCAQRDHVDQRLAQAGDVLARDREARRRGVTAVATDGDLGAPRRREQRLVEIDAAGGARRAPADAGLRVDTDDEGRPLISIDELGRDDPDHAGRPAPHPR